MSVLITFPGMPATTQLSGISVTTTQFAPITQLLPTLTSPKIFAPVAIKQLSPIIGTFTD